MSAEPALTAAAGSLGLTSATNLFDTMASADSFPKDVSDILAKVWRECEPVGLSEKEIERLHKRRKLQEKADRYFCWWGWLPWAHKRLSQYEREIEALSLYLENNEVSREVRHEPS